MPCSTADDVKTSLPHPLCPRRCLCHCPVPVAAAPPFNPCSAVLCNITPASLSFTPVPVDQPSSCSLPCAQLLAVDSSP
jgi:hypothetical protein